MKGDKGHLEQGDYLSTIESWIRRYNHANLCDAIRYLFKNLPENLEYFEHGRIIKEYSDLGGAGYYINSPNLLAIVRDELFGKEIQYSKPELKQRMNIISDLLTGENNKKVDSNKKIKDFNDADWKKTKGKFDASKNLLIANSGSKSEGDTIKLLTAILGLRKKTFDTLLSEIEKGNTNLGIEREGEIVAEPVRKHGDQDGVDVDKTAYHQELTETDETSDIEQTPKSTIFSKVNLLILFVLILITVFGGLSVRSIFTATKPKNEKEPQILSQQLFGKGQAISRKPTKSLPYVVITAVNSVESINGFEAVATNEVYVTVSLVNNTNESFFPDRFYMRYELHEGAVGSVNPNKVSLNVRPNLEIELAEEDSVVEYHLKNENGFVIDAQTQRSTIIKIKGTYVLRPQTSSVIIGWQLRPTVGGQSVKVESKEAIKITFTE